MHPGQYKAMDYLADTTKILLLAIFDFMSIFFVVGIIFKIVKKLLNKATGKKNEFFD